MAGARTAGARKHATGGRESTPVAIPPFSRSLPLRLLLAREAVVQRFRPLIHARGFTEQQWRVMRVLSEIESLEIVELAALCTLHPASLSRILPKLAAAGIVSRCSNAADQRRVIVSLTPHGRRLLEAAQPDFERVYAQIASDLGQERLDQVYRALDALIGALAEKPNGVTGRSA